MKIKLPKKNEVVKTSDSDPVFLYYNFLVKHPFIIRLEKTIDLLGKKKYGRLLEIGTGSGILIPELMRHCEKLYCIDIHKNIDVVSRFAKRQGIKGEVKYGDIFNLEYKPGYFDAIVCISVLEHLEDVGKALDNIKKVLKKDGVAVFGIPTRSAIGENIVELIAPGHKNRHISSDKKIIKEIKKGLK